MVAADLSSRAGLARAITLVESRRADHRDAARQLLETVMPQTGTAERIGVTGPPGVGKSTFIDALGTLLTDAGHRVAVLAVDPTSKRTGGSILGDKTRMERLAVDPNAFVRPSPAGASLGGVARTTRETILLCEAAGYDVIIVETVGVGQSETVVADMVDFFLALMLPNSGDELQGIKKGVLEAADMIAVNKSDIDPEAARRAGRTYANALHILEPIDPDWSPPTRLVSGATGDGLDEVWSLIEQHRKISTANGARERRRAAQQGRWFDSLLVDAITTDFASRSGVGQEILNLRKQVLAGSLPASTAADRAIQHVFGER